MTPSRTVVVGSALPLLILIGLLVLPPVNAGPDGSEPAPLGSGSDGLAPIAASGATASVGRAAAQDEDRSLALLRRSIDAAAKLSFSGTEVVSAWYVGGSTTRVLELVQGADGVRTINARDVGTESHTESEADGLAGLSERALGALAAGYELHAGAPGTVAGRSATMVVATRNGREAARLWLDDRTGLLLRQDVLDPAGRLRRMASFIDVTLPTATETSTVLGSTVPRRGPARPFGVGVTVPTARTSASGTPNPAGAWSDVVSPAELTKLRADGWPCPAALSAGYVLLDARRASAGSGATLHLTYSDGLSAVSVFLQRGDLDAAGLSGLSSRKWGDAEVYVRDGWPDVMVWQGGPTVITAIGDAEPAELQVILGALPRQTNHGTLGSLQQRMGSALAWLAS